MSKAGKRFFRRLSRGVGRWFARKGGLALLGCAALVGLVTCARKTPEDYIREFRRMDAAVRTRAGNELIRFDADEVLPLLIAEAESEWLTVRFEVMKMLGRFKDPRGVPAVIRGLDDRSPRVAAMAAVAVGMLRAPEALPALLMYSHDPSPQVRQYVIAALGPCHSYARDPALSDSAYSVVRRSLQSSTPEIRISALQSMREFGYRDAAEQIAAMAHDPAAEVRHVVVQSLGEIATAGIAAAAPADSTGPDPIAPVGEELRGQIVELLLEKLDPDEYQSIRTKAVRALAEIGDERAVPALERLQEQGTEDDRREAERALGNLEDGRMGE